MTVYQPIHSLKFDLAHSARNWCIAVLTLSWVAGILAIVLGIYYLDGPKTGGHLVVFSLTPLATDFISLAFNILVTFLNEGLGYIHTTSLRWALQKEDRLTFNSNLRLFSSSDKVIPNSLLANGLFIICLVLTYSTSSLIFAPLTYPDYQDSSSPSGSQFAQLDQVTLITLGAAITGQAVIATWALAHSTIETWSSNPIEVVKACIATGNLQRVPGRCMMSIADAGVPPQARLPQPRQPHCLSSHREVKWITIFFWVLVPLGGLWGGIVHWFIWYGEGDILQQGTNWSPIPIVSDGGSSSNFSPYIIWTFSAVSSRPRDSSLMALGFVSGVQAVLTIALHCLELIVNLNRDEKVWRSASSPHGCQCSSYNSITAALKSGPAVTLFTFKVAIHWFFGLSVRKFVERDNGMAFLRFRPVQIFYMTVLVLVLGVIVTAITLRKQRGPQPCAYGHLQTLADLIDEWPSSGDFFWGHKGEDEIGYLHAGTSEEKLEKVRMECFYR